MSKYLNRSLIVFGILGCITLSLPVDASEKKEGEDNKHPKTTIVGHSKVVEGEKGFKPLEPEESKKVLGEEFASFVKKEKLLIDKVSEPKKESTPTKTNTKKHK